MTLATEVVKVAYVFPGGATYLGGAETQALGFFRHFDRSRLAVNFVLLGPHDQFESAVRALGDVSVFQLNPRGVPLYSPIVVQRYWRLVRREWFAVVHLYGLRHEVWSRCVSRHGRARVVSAIRGMESHRSRLVHLLNRASAGCVDVWISNSATVRDLFIRRDGLPGERILVVPNGVEVGKAALTQEARAEARASLGLAADDWCIGCVANHNPAKRISDLIDALAILEKQGILGQLVLIGQKTPHTEELVARARDLGVGDRVFVLGFRNDARILLPLLDCVALASEKEGLSSALLEAMADGVPVVTTDTGGATELVKHGESGLVIPVGRPTELAAAIAQLARSPEWARVIGARGKVRATVEYSMDRLARSLEGIYRNLARGADFGGSAES